MSVPTAGFLPPLSCAALLMRLGLQPTKGNGRQPSRKVLRRLEEIENLPRRDQDALLRTIDAFLSKSAA